MKFITLHRTNGGPSFEFFIAVGAIATFESFNHVTGAAKSIVTAAGDYEPHTVTETVAEIVRKLRAAGCTIEGQDDPADLEPLTFELGGGILEELEARVDALGEEVGP